MKVAFYSASAEDLYRHRLPVARSLGEAGYQVVFVGPDEPFADTLEDSGFTYHRLRRRSSGITPLGELVNGIRLGSIYRREMPDIVHHFGLAAIVEGGTAARVAGINWVVHSVRSLDHGKARPPLLRRGLRTVVRWAMREAEVTAPCAEDRQLLVSKGCVRPEKAHIVGSGAIDLQSVVYKSEPDRVPVVAFIGDLSSTDDANVFAHAARTFRQSERPGAARFVIVAPADVDDNVRVLLERRQEEGIVEWWPRTGNLESVLASVHVVYAPSCRDDSFRRTLLTAAAMGRVIVACDSRGCRDLVRQNATGLLVPAEDDTALATAFKTLIEDPARRQEMGRQARTFVENEHAAKRVAKDLMAVYERLFERGREI